MEKQFGFIAMLDALGVSNYKIDEASQFIRQKNALISELEKEADDITALFNNVIAEGKLEFPKMTIATFGDTLIICWPTDSPKDSLIKFPGIGRWLQGAIALGIKYGILLRGSISIGEYLIEGNTTILGPAIADANAWAEEADWFGVILTPHCQIFLTTLLDNKAMRETTKVNGDYLCVKYPVPTHNGKKDLFVISWPYFFLGRFKNREPGSVTLSQLLSNHNIPKGVESKYENSIEFFTWYEEKKYPALLEDMKERIQIQATKK